MPDKVVRQALSVVAETKPHPVPLSIPRPTRKSPIKYPSTDGKPMADNIEQERTMSYAGGTLRAHFRHRKDILVAVDLLVYYVEGDKDTSVAPDVMVVRGVHSGLRGSYRVFEEGKAPDFVLEVLSKSTHLNDEGDKRKAYARMGVHEYFRYDPRGRTMARKPGGRRLVGERLEGGAYRELPRGPDGSIYSEALGLYLRVRRQDSEPHWKELRFWDPATGEDLRTFEEEREERVRANLEAKAANQRAGAANQRAEAEAKARRRADQRAEAEAKARRRAEQRVAELEARLAAKR